MKNYIDLLPPSVRDAKKFRKRVKLLLLAQCAVFLLLGGAIFYLREAEREAWAESRALSERVSAISSAAAEVARANAVREMLEEALVAEFDGEWVDLIVDAIPDGAELSRIDYNRGEILITARTADINIIETHRANMSQVFAYIRQGRITGDSDGLYTYEIRVIPTTDLKTE